MSGPAGKSGNDDAGSKTGAGSKPAGRRGRPTRSEGAGPTHPNEFSEEDLHRVQLSLPWWVQEADRLDVAQDSLLKGLWKRIPVAGGELVAYASAIAPKLLLDRQRKKGGVALLEVEKVVMPDSALGPAGILEATEALLNLRAKLERLPVQSLQLLTWRFVDGEPLAAIAGRLGVTSKAVERRLARIVETARGLCRGFQGGAEKKSVILRGKTRLGPVKRDEPHA